jgi:hypothetical protein
MGCPKAQSLSRPVVEFIHNLLDFIVGDDSQVLLFWGTLRMSQLVFSLIPRSQEA